MVELAPERKKLVNSLEGLALKVVMLDEGDIPGLGVFLNHLEELLGLLDAEQAAEVGPLLKHLEEAGNKLILQEITVPAQGQELLNQGVGLLLSWARENRLPTDGEE